jgi:hypothetical protein
MCGLRVLPAGTADRFVRQDHLPQFGPLDDDITRPVSRVSRNRDTPANPPHNHRDVSPRRVAATLLPEQPVVESRRHSAGDAYPLTALLLHRICSAFSVVAPCQRGVSLPSVLRRDFRHGLTGAPLNTPLPRCGATTRL